MKIMMIEKTDRIVVFDGDARMEYKKSDFISDYTGSYQDGKTVGDALKEGKLKIVQDGMQRGCIYYN